MIKKKSLNALEQINKGLDLELKVGGILRGQELDVETDPNGDQYGSEIVWYYRLIEKNNEYYLVDCTENGDYEEKDICKECSLQYLTKDELNDMIKNMWVVE